MEGEGKPHIEVPPRVPSAEDAQFLQAMHNLVREMSTLYEARTGRPAEQAPILLNPQAVYDYFRPLMVDLPYEQMRVANLTTRGELISAPLLFQGPITGMDIRVADIFRQAIVDSADSVIMVHNHPSGDPTPTKADIHATERAFLTGKLLDIEVRDHLVIATRGFTSLREQGLGFEVPKGFDRLK